MHIFHVFPAISALCTVAAIPLPTRYWTPQDLYPRSTLYRRNQDLHIHTNIPTIERPSLRKKIDDHYKTVAGLVTGARSVEVGEWQNIGDNKEKATVCYSLDSTRRGREIKTLGEMAIYRQKPPKITFHEGVPRHHRGLIYTAILEHHELLPPDDEAKRAGYVNVWKGWVHDVVSFYYSNSPNDADKIGGLRKVYKPLKIKWGVGVPEARRRDIETKIREERKSFGEDHLGEKALIAEITKDWHTSDDGKEHLTFRWYQDYITGSAYLGASHIYRDGKSHFERTKKVGDGDVNLPKRQRKKKK